MAVALVTTFYGSVLANLVFIPIANKLKLKSKEEILRKEIMVEGLLSIQAVKTKNYRRKVESIFTSKARTGLQYRRQEGIEQQEGVEA